MRIVLSTFLVLICMLQTSCTFSKKTPEEAKAEAVDEVSKKFSQVAEDKKSASLVESDINVSFVGGDSPHLYFLKLDLGKAIPIATVNLGNSRPLTFKEQSTLVIELEHGVQYVSIQIKTYTKDKTLASHLSLGSFDVPMDYTFSKREVLTQNLYPRPIQLGVDNESAQLSEASSSSSSQRIYNRIFFEEDSVVVLNGYNLTIESNEVIALKDARIVQVQRGRFDEMKLFSQIVLDGSNVSIKAKKVTGNFLIGLTGVSGIDGRNASTLAMKTPEVLQPAQAGKNGLDAIVRNIIRTKKLGGIGDSVEEDFFCERQPTNGENGADGALIHGEDGGDGGNTGDLLIDIEDYSQSKFQIYFYPGVGGRGGEGDFVGQVGGAGGAPGKTVKKICSEAKSGKNGRTTTTHDSKAGMNGKLGSYGTMDVPQDQSHFLIEMNPYYRH